MGMATGTTAMALAFFGCVARRPLPWSPPNILFGGVVVAVHHGNSDEQDQNTAADLERAHADTEYFQQDTAAQRKDDNHDENG